MCASRAPLKRGDGILKPLLNITGKVVTDQDPVSQFEHKYESLAGVVHIVENEEVAAITPLRRLGMPEDIAGAVVFLASSLADYLNGEYLPVTGGSFMI